MPALETTYTGGDTPYASFFEKPAESLFEHPPQCPEWDPELVAAINAYQGRIGSKARIEGNECVIVTGQQPGIFAGPLYTVYKALTAVALAKEVEERHGKRCIPLFWLAGDDHDFDEASSVSVLTKDDEPLELRYRPETDITNRPLHAIKPEPSLHELIDEAANSTRGSEFREDIRAFLHETLDDSESICDWTARSLAKLFESNPIPIFVPHLPEARKVAATVLRQDIANPLASTRLINEGAQNLESQGFTPLLVKKNRECNFFIEDEGRRQKIIFEENAYKAGPNQARFTIDELLKRLDAEPAAFSPNVALRPIVQQHLFPTLAYVAGPGEVAYWAQFGGLFAHFGRPMPVVYPRAQLALMTTKHRKLLSKHGLDLEDLYSGPSQLIERALANAHENPAVTKLRAGRPDAESALEKLIADVAGASKGADEPARRTQQRIAEELDRLERTLLHADDERVQATRRQIQRLCNALAPNRKPQERVYTVYSFLFEHGWQLVPRLLATMDIHNRAMQEVEL